MEKIFENYAPKYYEKGLIAVPLVANTKVSYDENWQKREYYNDKKRLIEKFSSGNIGLLLGEITGVIAVDIDKDSAMELVPPSPVRKKGAKGETRFFKYNGEVGRKRHDLGIEILSTGNQTVVPPSIHPETRMPYIWLTPDNLLNFSIEDLPVLPNDFINMLDSDSATVNLNISKSDGSRCNHGSHNKLSSMLVAALHNGDSPDVIVKSLIEYDDKINEHVSYFLCPSRRWRSPDRIANAYWFVTEGMQRVTRKGEVSSINLNTKKITIVDDTKEQLEKMKLPKLTGIAQEMFLHIIKNSSQERTHFAFPTAMMAISTIIGNKIQFNGITPNLYTLVVGESGSGKTTSFNFIKDLLMMSPLGINLLGASTITSVNGITQTLKNYRTQVSIIDEASSLFETINDKKGQGESISATLSEVYTSTNKVFLGKNVAREKDPKNSKGNIGGCFSPYLNLLMGTTFEAFEKTFTANLINRGFIGRGDIYFDYKSKRDKDRENAPIPKNFVDFLEMWRNVKNEQIWDNKIDRIDLDENVSLRPFSIPEARLKQDSEELYREIINEIRTLKENSSKKENPVIAIINRMEVLFIKYAIITAASNNPETTNILITKKDLRFAYDLVKSNLNNAKLIISEKMFEGHRKMFMQKIIAFIKENKSATKDDIGKRFKYYMNKKTREEYISELVDTGVIEESLCRNARVYSIKSIK